MKQLIIIILFFSSSMLLASHEKDSEKKCCGQRNEYKITIVNLTKGQPITPPLVTIHSPDSQLFHLGQETSSGLKELSQDGNTDTLLSELNANSKFIRSQVGEGIILPGQKTEIKIVANKDNIFRFKVSVVAMLARTNDAFIAIDKASLPVKKAKVVYLASVYDSGAEFNTELCRHIPAPPCNQAGVGTQGGEGFVHPHPGLQNIGDLKPIRDAFASKAAKVIIERVRKISY